MSTPKRTRRRIAAMGTLAGCVLYVVCSAMDQGMAFHGVDLEQTTEGGQRRHLRSDDSSSFNHRLREASSRVRELLAITFRSPPPPPELISQGPGPELVGPDGQVFRFQGGPPRRQGIPWYNALSSPRFEWHVAPYHWKTCPDDEDGDGMFLGDTGFAFHIPDPDDPSDPSKVKSKYLRFRVLRRDERECLWNYSKACLAGGSLVMNFGLTAKDILRPGDDYTLKTPEGTIRIVAYNVNRDCIGPLAGGPPHVSSSSSSAGAVDVLEKTPIDYLREVQSHASNPEGCAAWIDQREQLGDLLSFNSDFSVVHVDTPWMRILLQVRHKKVSTEEMCVHANMNVRITDISPGILDDGYDGLLGGNSLPPPGEGSMAKHRILTYNDAEEHKVDGPFVV